MKRKVLSVLLIVAFNTLMFGQVNLLFEENFETYPLTTFVRAFNGLDLPIPSGASPCGNASVGNTTNYNSTNVNFNIAENNSQFLGVNPEMPCGGYFNDELIYTGTIDIASVTDQLRFKCNYFKSSTLGWGDAELKVTIGDGTNEWIIESQFTATNTWTALELDLPASFTTNITSIRINIGGGEGVGIDNIAFVHGASLSVDEWESANTISIYPNPVKDILSISNRSSSSEDLNIRIYDITGKLVVEQTKIVKEINLNFLTKGIYVLEIEIEKGKLINKKIVKL